MGVTNISSQKVDIISERQVTNGLSPDGHSDAKLKESLLYYLFREYNKYYWR